MFPNYVTQRSSFLYCLLDCFFVRPIIIDISILPINRYDNLIFSFVNLSHVLKGLYAISNGNDISEFQVILANKEY